jgi:hypothetical protein
MRMEGKAMEEDTKKKGAVEEGKNVKHQREKKQF